MKYWHDSDTSNPGTKILSITFHQPLKCAGITWWGEEQGGSSNQPRQTGKNILMVSSKATQSVFSLTLVHHFE